MNFKAETCKLPQGALYDKQFHNWSVREVYEFLKKEQKQNKDKQSQQGEGQGSGDGVGKPRDLSTLDEHDFENATEMTPEQVAEQAGKIDKALRQGNILAGRMGSKMPRAIEELLEPKIDWRHVLREFVTSTMRGSDEYTWRRFNKRLMANDYYLPSMENEAVGELVVAIDTSGSIGGVELTEFASELASICSVCSPSKVRVLWWDTEVHKEQVFEGDYNNIASLLKPEGGGGTHVSCVNKYLLDNKVNSEAVLVFTDGYVENDIEWTISTPTLWVVTQRRDFVAPSGQVIRKD
jgi:predicted metal-dependent peptidase